MFMNALQSMGKLTDPMFGNIEPDSTVDLFFNLSSDGKDQPNALNSEPTFKYVADPTPQG